MKNIIQKINEISEKAKGQFKPDLKKYGKNFRAISESAVLDVLNPLFKEYEVSYEVVIKNHNLKIEKIKVGRDTSGNIIEKLLFVADVEVCLLFHNPEEVSYDNPDRHGVFSVCGWGSGVDYGDKATGKALTAAVKYALFKGLRLQYSDDPDAEASEEIESIVEEESKQEKSDLPKKKSENKKSEETLASEAQLSFVKGLAIACGISDEDFKKKYGFYPYDTNIPMRKAREIIDELKKLQDEKLPF